MSVCQVTTFMYCPKDIEYWKLLTVLASLCFTAVEPILLRYIQLLYTQCCLVYHQEGKSIY